MRDNNGNKKMPAVTLKIPENTKIFNSYKHSTPKIIHIVTEKKEEKNACI